MQFSLDVLRARKGDCLLLHYGNGNKPHLIIIDGGPSDVYRPQLKPRLAATHKARGLDEQEPFEIDAQAAHLFKHPYLGIEDIEEVWSSDPLFYPARPPAHWLMCAEVGGRVLMVPLAPTRSGNPQRCRGGAQNLMISTPCSRN